MRQMRFIQALLGASAVAALAATSAAGGSGVGGIFNLGQPNTVDAQTTLSGNPGASPQLRLVNGGTGAALRAESQAGIGLNGTSASGIGQFGQSQTGIGLQGLHASSTGASPGIEGKTNSTDPGGAAIVARNTGGGPGFRAIVAAGAPPLAVNSQVKVQDLNADKLDNLDSTALWKLGGNAGTMAGTDFLGTTDNKSLVFKTNNAEAIRLDAAGNVGIGTAAPSEKLEVNGNIRAGGALSSQGFEGTAFPPTGWTTDGWTRDTAGPFEGTAYAGDAPTGCCGHTLHTTFTFPTRGVVRFAWSHTLGPPTDRLLFCVDPSSSVCSQGEESISLNYNSGWTTVAVPVAAGTHTLTWSYTTTGGGKASLDAVQFEAVRDIQASGAVTGAGTARALIHYNGTLERCYRGDENSTPANRYSCASPWSVSGSGGDTTITFPFKVNDGVVTVTAEYTGAPPVFATYDFPNSNQIHVRTYSCGSGCTPISATYSLAVF